MGYINRFIIIFIGLYAGSTFIASDQSAYTTRFTAIKCFNNDKYVSKVSCRLKPVRGSIGIISTTVYFKRDINDLWMQSNLLYKFGTIYREWLIKYDIDICDTISGRPMSDAMAKMIAKFWKQHVRQHGCPFKDVFNVTLNADNSTSNLLFDKIPRLPEGDYKNINRFHTKRNESIWWYEVKFIVKSKSAANRTSMLDMG